MKTIWHFVLHLRIHYQIGILSGCYLLGALFVRQLDILTFWQQFLNVHLLLFAGATAFNSYWDKDEGPIGGLKNPPPMKRWMRDFSIFMQFVGLIWATTIGMHYVMVYAISMLLFWLYSSPLTRWKSHPFLSMVAIGGSTGFGGFLLGYLAGGGSFTLFSLLPGLAATFILLSLYPISQIYQMQEDKERGDHTFVVHFGIRGVIQFFMISYIAGILLLSISLRFVDPVISGFFLSISGMSGLIIWMYLKNLKGLPSEYKQIMRIKYLASVLFVAFIIICYVQIHVLDAKRIFQTESQRIAYIQH